MTVETSILKGIISTKIPIAPTRGELDRMIRKTNTRATESFIDLAFTIGRNWAISKARRATTELNRLKDASLHKENVRAERAAFNTAKRQARRLIAWLTPDIKPTQQVQLQIVWWRVFEKKSAEEVASLLPLVSRDTRIKRYQRGRDLLLRHAGPVLTEYLSHRVSPTGGLTSTELP